MYEKYDAASTVQKLGAAVKTSGFGWSNRLHYLNAMGLGSDSR